MVSKLIYTLLKAYCNLTMRIYFRRFQVTGLEKIPKNSAIIYAANHQNAFLDAVALIVSQPYHPVYLVRASVFNSAIARFWLKTLRMLPIYRVRDGIRSVSRNNDIIDQCANYLRKNEPIGIFPEGNHHLAYRLLRLQKGITRIAFAAMELDSPPENLYIVPVGINYYDHLRFRSNLLINFGDPIPVQSFHRIFKEDPVMGTSDLLDEIRKGLMPLMLHIEPEENYEQILKEWKSGRQRKPTLYEEFETDKKLIEVSGRDKVPQLPLKNKKGVVHWIEKIIGFPFFLFGLINNILCVLGMYLIQKILVTDIHFISPIKYAAGVFLVPIIYLVQFSLILLFLTPGWLVFLIYAIAVPVLGIYAYDYYRRQIHP